VESDGLEAGHDPAQLLGRVARDVQGTSDDALAGRHVAFLEGVDRRVEHLRERGDVLDRSVVELLRDPSPLGPLREQPLGEQMVVAQSIIASRSAMATACVRVSASSLARMWRT
jgi:hypothetical protein